MFNKKKNLLKNTSHSSYPEHSPWWFLTVNKKHKKHRVSISLIMRGTRIQKNKPKEMYEKK